MNGNYDWTGRSTTTGAPPRGYSQGTPNMGNNMTIFPIVKGHMIQNEEDIRPTDIPVDGSPGWFPSQNLNFVVMRKWNDQGSFDTILYVPYQEPARTQHTSQTTPDPNDGIMEILTQITARLDKVEKSVNRRYNYKNKPHNKEEQT